MKRIKALRRSRHLNQQRLAFELNISQAAVSKYELGQSEPDIQMIKKLSEFFNVSADYLLELSDSKFNVSDDALSETEKKLLSDFKRLDDIQKLKLIAYLQGLLQE